MEQAKLDRMREAHKEWSIKELEEQIIFYEAWTSTSGPSARCKEMAGYFHKILTERMGAHQ